VSSRFVRPHGLVVVRCRPLGDVDEQRCRLALDTGAVHTLIRPGLLALVGHTTVVDQIPLSTVGNAVMADRVLVRELWALGKVQRDVLVVSRDLPRELRIDGLLGLDFLRNSRLTIDFRRVEVELDA
jgi:hypothetical protein